MTAKQLIQFQKSQIRAIKKDYIGYVLHLPADKRPVSLNNYTLRWIDKKAASFRYEYNKNKNC